MIKYDRRYQHWLSFVISPHYYYYYCCYFLFYHNQSNAKVSINNNCNIFFDDFSSMNMNMMMIDSYWDEKVGVGIEGLMLKKLLHIPCICLSGIHKYLRIMIGLLGCWMRGWSGMIFGNCGFGIFSMFWSLGLRNLGLIISVTLTLIHVRYCLIDMNNADSLWFNF